MKKKIILTTLILTNLVTAVGCKSDEEGNNTVTNTNTESEKTMELSYKGMIADSQVNISESDNKDSEMSHINIREYTDQETGVVYLILEGTDRNSCTISMYNADGTFKTTSSVKNNEEGTINDRYVGMVSGEDIDIREYIDNDTNVKYLIVENGINISATPMYNANGSLKTSNNDDNSNNNYDLIELDLIGEDWSTGIKTMEYTDEDTKVKYLITKTPNNDIAVNPIFKADKTLKTNK